MVDNFTSTAAFMTAIAGEWTSPVTGTRFYFTPVAAQDSEGILTIRPGNNGYTASFNFTAQSRSGDIILVTGANRYPVWIIGKQVKSMAIFLSPGEILQLVRRK